MSTLQNMDTNVESEAPKPRYPSFAKERTKERLLKMKEQGNYKRARFEYDYDSVEERQCLLDQMSYIKEIIGGDKKSKVTNKQLLSKLCNHFIESHTKGEANIPQSEKVQTFHYIKRNECDDDQLFVGSLSALEHLLSRSNMHRNVCSETLKAKSNSMSGHVIDVTFSCKNKHNIDWNSSPYIEGGKFLVNMKIAHGYFVSGMLPNQYERLSSASGIGTIAEKDREAITKLYRPIVHKCAQDSMDSALIEEIAVTDIQNNLAQSDTDNWSGIDMLRDGIDIMTDARYSTRKNAKFTDVISIGEGTHKVLSAETVSKKTDDPCTQRHEKIGMKRTFDYFDEKSCPLRSVTHDNCGPTSKLIKERGDIEDNKDTWHCTKKLTTVTSKIGKGKAKNHGTTWHSELKDKAAPLKTHCLWSMKYSNGNPQKLRSNLLNFVNHYKGKHENCFDTSRCKVEAENYVCTKTAITCPEAEEILTNHIKGLKAYKNAEEYSNCKDTHYVESFNNALLQYQDKRIGTFSYDSYRMRTDLSILDWNEHVNRPFTSTRNVSCPKNPRRSIDVKVRKKKTFTFWNTLLNNFLDYPYNSPSSNS